MLGVDHRGCERSKLQMPGYMILEHPVILVTPRDPVPHLRLAHGQPGITGITVHLNLYLVLSAVVDIKPL